MPTNTKPNVETNCMVVEGISLDPSFAVNAHAVQHKAEDIEYQNHLVLRVAAAALMIRFTFLRSPIGVEAAAELSASLSATAAKASSLVLVWECS